MQVCSSSPTLVIELADRDELSEVSFDVARAETEAREAKAVSVEVGDKIDGPWARSSLGEVPRIARRRPIGEAGAR